MAEETFEDAFMDIQTGLVSLVLEALEGVAGVSRVYIFGAVEEGMTSFNACVQLGERIERLDAVVCDRGILLQVMGLGASDLEGLVQLCTRHGRACPTQLRGCYDMGGGYDARYSYEPLASRAVDPVAPGTAFAAWVEELRAGGDLAHVEKPPR
ncbi:hypothetical protein [Enorma sp.]|uniref:hypothetical protein n=1 Tax=Enorma sp. TaxID=1920692 RepID=UPI003AB5504F